MKMKLGQLYKISSGGTPSKAHKEYYEGGNINWVKTGNLKQKYLYGTEDSITALGLEKSSAKMYEADTVLIAMYGATIGATSILKIPACTNQACAAFPKIDSVLPEYLYYFLNSKRKRFVQDGVGGAQPNISGSYLKEVEFNLLDLKEQDNIVKVLDDVNSMILSRKQQLEALDELIKSKFIEMFGDPIKNEKDYSIVPISEIADYFNGLTYKPENVSDEGTIVLRSSNIQDSSLDFKDIVRVNCSIRDRFMVQENDILMCSRNGSARLVGKVALIRNLKEPMSFGAFMMIIRSRYFAYLMTYFQLDAFRMQITTGATTTINQITGRMMDQIEVPVPDDRTLQEFEQFVQQVDKHKSTIQKSLDETQMLFDSLMQKYFG